MLVQVPILYKKHILNTLVFAEKNAENMLLKPPKSKSEFKEEQKSYKNLLIKLLIKYSKSSSKTNWYVEEN